MDPRSFLDPFRRKTTPSNELSAAFADLDRLARDRPELEGPARSLSRVLGAAFLTPETRPIDPVELPAMAEGWAEGIPAFRSRWPSFDEPAMIARARAIAGVSEGPSASDLSESIRKKRVDLVGLSREVLAGRPEEVARSAEKSGVASETLAMVLRVALLPALARWSAALDSMRAESQWTRGDCPGCGSRLLLAESRGLEQRIAYRCGLCAADWPGERLGCPSCGETRPKSLRSSFVEGEQERFRLASCETCGNHWKIIATLSPLSAPRLMVVDLSTFHLDVLGEAPEPTGEV